MMTILMLLVQVTPMEAMIEKEHRKVSAAEKVLESDPTDAAANLAVGKFWCFTANDWDKGTPMLAICSDEKLVDLLSKEGKQGEEIIVAEGWWEVGSKLKGLDQRNVMNHALSAYAKAWQYLPNAKEKGKALARCNQAAKLRGPIDIRVSGKTAWTEVPACFVEGMALSVTAQGSWNSTAKTDKAGWAGAKGHEGSKLGEGGPVPDAPIMCLIGKMESEKPVSVLTGSFKVTKSGRMSLGPNDGTLADNQGELVIRIEVK